MAATDNTMKNWFEGLPNEGTNVVANNSGTMKYFFEGLPSEYVFQPGAARVYGFIF